MPRIVDPDQRRGEIIEATTNLIAERGLESATMRGIAEACGCTTGLITHYFGDKEEILLEVLRYCHLNESERLSEALAAAEPHERLCELVRMALPLDEVRILDWRVWLAFWGHVALSDRIQERMLSRYNEWTELITHNVAETQVAQGISPSSSVLADGLVSLIDGLSVRAVVQPDSMPEQHLLEIIESYLIATGLMSSPAAVTG